MGAQAKSKFIRRLNRWRLRKSPLKVAFLLFLWLVAIASEAKASGGDLKNNGTIINTGTIKIKNAVTGTVGLPATINGTIEFFGTNQTIPEKNYNNLSITGTGINNTVGGVNFTVNGDLTIASTAQLNVEANKVITLNGNIVEQGYLSGSIQKIVDLSTLPSDDFGGIGATLSWSGTTPGLTTVKRTSGIALNGGGAFVGNQSIKRYYDVALSSGGFTGTFVFRYDPTHELNSLNENSLELWRSTDGGASWRRQGGTVNTTNHTITKTGILAFSRWTASDATHPLGSSYLEWVAQNLVSASGGGQTGAPSTNLASPFVVTVTDGYANPIANTPVTFAIASSPGTATGQSLTVTTTTTNSSGQASTILHLGSAAGSYTVTATSGSLTGSPVSFSATASGTAPPPVTPVATSMILATGNSQVDTVGRQLANPMVVTILNQFGAPFTGATVNFAISNRPLGETSAALSTTSVTTNSSGQASTLLTLGTKPGTYTVVATSPSLSGASITFSGTAVVGRAYTLASPTGNGQSQVVKTTLTQPFVVTVTDIFGNPITGASVQFAITKTPSGSNGQAISDTFALTDAQGRAQTVLTLGDSAGVYEVSAISALLLGSPVVFAATASSPAATPAARSIVLRAGNGQSGTVGAQLASPLVVTVFDQFGKPFAGTRVNFAIAGKPSGDTSAVLTALSAVTDTGGQVSALLKLGTKAGLYTVTATSDSLFGSPQTFTATAVAGPPAIAILPSGIVMSGQVAMSLNQAIVAALMDVYGNPVGGTGVRFSIVASPGGAVGQSPMDTTVTTDLQGLSSIQFITGTKAGIYTIQVSAGSLSPRFITINATAGPAKNLAAVSGNGQSSVPGGTLTQPMVVAVTDSYGNPVNGVEVNFAITSIPDGAIGQSLSATSVVTGPDGRAAASLTLGSKVGLYVVSASSASLTGSLALFSAGATGSGVAARLVSTSGDGGSAPVVTRLASPFVVKLLDANGNPVAGQPVRFSLSGIPAGSSGAALSDTLLVTDAQGQVSTYLILGTKVGTYTVSVFSGSVSAISFTTSAVAGPAARLAVVAGNDQFGAVSSPLAQRFIVSVTDAYGNAKPGATVDFALASAPANASGQTLTSVESVTDAAGLASALLVLGDKAGAYRVSATSAGLSGSPVLFAATATSSIAVRLLYTAGDKQSAEVFTALPDPLAVTVLDAGGNPVPGQPVRFTLGGVPLGSSGSSLSDTLVITNAQGQATTRLTLGTKIGEYVVTATSGSLSGSPVNFTAIAVAGRPVYLVLADGNNQNGLAANTLSDPLVVAVTDTFGNAKPGVAVTYAISTFPDSATGQRLTSTNVLTDADGEASVRLTLGSHLGAYTVSATSGTLHGSPVVFNVVAMRVIGSNQVGIVSNRLQQPFSTIVLDSLGKPRAGVFVTFTIDSVPGNASGASFNGSTTIRVMTDSNGVASTFLTLGNQTGTYRVTATAPELPDGAVVFRALAVSSAGLATIIYRSGDNQSAQILTQIPNPLEVTVLAADGSPKAGQKVKFGIVSGPNDAVGQLVTPEVVTTDGSGRASASVKVGSKAGIYRVAATSTGLGGSPVEFQVLATAGQVLSLVYVAGDSQTQLIGRTLDSAFIVRVVDVGDNPVSGIQVQFALDSIPGGATGQRLNVLNSVTDAQGRAAAILTFGDRAGVYKVTAALSGHVPIVFRATATTSTGAVKLLYASGDAQSAQILTQLANPIAVSVLNEMGNPVAGQTVTFTVDSIPTGATGQLVTPSVATTDASGSATAQVTVGDKVGVYKISAMSAGLSGSPVVFRLRASAGVPRTMVAVSGEGQRKQIGLALDSAFAVRVMDQGGNPVSGVVVQFSLESVPLGAAGQRLTVLNSITDIRGRASAILTLGTKTGAYSVTVTSPVIAGTTVRFTATANPGAAAAMVLTSGNEQSAFIFSELAAPFLVTVVDVGGNPVAGVNVQFAIDSIPRSAVGQALRILNSTTDENGQASAVLRLGNKEGRYTVLATAPNLIVSSVRFAATATVLTGDVNSNSMVDIADLTTVVDHLLGKIRLVGIDSVKADYNRDGRVDVADIVAMRNYLLTIQLTNNSFASLDADQFLPLNMALAAGDSATDVRGEFVITENGIRLNVTNSIPLKGVQVIARIKPGINLARPDVIFDRARVDSFYYNISGNEIRIVAYNLKNVAIPAGDGPLFRLPINVLDVSSIESAQLLVSKADNEVIYDQTLARTISARKVLQGEIPTSFVLYQNYPNPFNERTNIEYEVADASVRVDVKVQVFNALGEKVKTLASGVHGGGRFMVVWDGTDDAGRKLASGAYYYRLISGTFMSARKMIMLK